MRLMLLLLCLSTPLVAQEKTYDLSFEAVSRAGQKSKLVETSQMSVSMLANNNGVPTTDERTVFEATEIVLSADAKGNAEIERTFLKAQRLEQGSMKPYGFQGRTVKVVVTEGQPDKFSYTDGSAISAADLKVLEDTFDGTGGDGDDDNPLNPGRRLRVGESWSPDIMAVAKMFDEEMGKSADLSKSKARFTLTSVEKRKGVEFGKIDGVIEIALLQLGPLRLDTPVMMKMKIDIDACIDGSQRDGIMKMAMRMRGSSVANTEGQKFNLDMDMTANNELSRTTLK
jgi:hypothetical protein